MEEDDASYSVIIIAKCRVRAKRILSNWQPLPEVWAGAAHGDAAFWSDMPAERVLLLVGRGELYRDGVVEAGGIIGASNPAGSAIQLVVCPEEVHIQMSADLSLGIYDGYMLNTALRWFRSMQDSRRSN